MTCWICNSPAQAICRFCGRAICRAHARSLPFVLEMFRRQSDKKLMGLAVDSVVHCGLCRPEPEPVPLDFVD